MILWQRQATDAWLAENEFRLTEMVLENLAVISRPGRTRSLVQITCGNRAQAENLIRLFGGVSQPLPRDWAQPQPVHAPIRIGRRLQIVSEPPDPEKTDAKFPLIIPAAGAFGTGEHATTAMSLRLLEEETRQMPSGWRLLDAGTGTGIFALAARRLGAREVLGLDNDPRAIAHARQNARLNRISRAKFLHADVLQWEPPGHYEIITANLFSKLLIAALPTFRRTLRRDGFLIASGILRGQAASVVNALRKGGFQLMRQRRRAKWVALLARQL
ncbi:MAG: 50S ribosomal protein L11 methyltransferase [Chthoniobacterales bacterium]